jgi:hypothetical protein
MALPQLSPLASGPLMRSSPILRVAKPEGNESGWDGLGAVAQETDTVSKKSQFCKESDLMVLFQLTGLGYYTQELPLVNPEHSIRRAHFLELVVRLAVTKFCFGQQEKLRAGVANAVGLFCDMHLAHELSRIPRTGIVEKENDPDEFRCTLLYTPAVEQELAACENFLILCYNTIFPLPRGGGGRKGRSSGGGSASGGGMPGSTLRSINASRFESRAASVQASTTASRRPSRPQSPRGGSSSDGHLLPGLGNLSAAGMLEVDSDAFRGVRAEHVGVCTRRPKGTRMGMAQWCGLMEFLGLLKANTGITTFHQRLAFRRAQMQVVQDNISTRTFFLSFVDFLEVRDRMALRIRLHRGRVTSGQCFKRGFDRGALLHADGEPPGGLACGSFGLSHGAVLNPFDPQTASLVREFLLRFRLLPLSAALEAEMFGV